MKKTMKKTFYFLSQITAVAMLVMTLTFATVSKAQAEDAIRDEMMQMGQHLVFAIKADDINTFEQNITAFITAAQAAQQIMPSKINGDQTEFKGYQAGMQEVIDLAKEAETLAQQNKLEEAKMKLSSMATLRKTYHMLYK